MNLAFIITISTVVYQRVTGPTYPVSGEVQLGESVIKYRLDRSHGGSDNHIIEIKVDDKSVCGDLVWKRYKTNDNWTSVDLERKNDKLFASLPHQPPAGKLQYQIILQKGNQIIYIPEQEEVVIRFKGDVPIIYLIPHVIFIFGAMLLSTRTGLEYFNKGKKFKPLTIVTFIFMIIGGFILGPIVQYYAFGAFWTGFPFGHDLTDNKVLIAFIGWLLAFIAIYKFKNPQRWIVFAAILMFIIFLIPHSVLGSELDYKELDKGKTQIENTHTN